MLIGGIALVALFVVAGQPKPTKIYRRKPKVVIRRGQTKFIGSKTTKPKRVETDNHKYARLMAKQHKLTATEEKWLMEHEE